VVAARTRGCLQRLPKRLVARIAARTQKLPTAQKACCKGRCCRNTEAAQKACCKDCCKEGLLQGHCPLPKRPAARTAAKKGCCKDAEPAQEACCKDFCKEGLLQGHGGCKDTEAA
jgi:hypothetical protein